ncbi:GNAT family N-acetyltransferase [Chloroflexia bacterium SDU3-3]|nr:GNAT family N-acetyltransferase [Chloroflexia bacterium SDU3-3]
MPISRRSSQGASYRAVEGHTARPFTACRKRRTARKLLAESSSATLGAANPPAIRSPIIARQTRGKSAMRMELPGLQRLTEHQLDAAVDSLTTAFQVDPSTQLLLNAQRPSLARVRAFYRFTMRVALRHGHVFAAGDRAQGVCAWLPPEHVDVSAWMFLRAGGVRLGLDVDLGIYARLLRYEGYAARMHARHAPFPHWYLFTIGVARDHQGQGLSGRLLRPAMAFLDRHGQHSYLETHSERNITFYQKYGYQVAEVGRLPGTGAPHWCMLRRPQG